MTALPPGPASRSWFGDLPPLTRDWLGTMADCTRRYDRWCTSRRHGR